MVESHHLEPEVILHVKHRLELLLRVEEVPRVGVRMDVADWEGMLDGEGAVGGATAGEDAADFLRGARARVGLDPIEEGLRELQGVTFQRGVLPMRRQPAGSSNCQGAVRSEPGPRAGRVGLPWGPQ